MRERPINGIFPKLGQAMTAAPEALEVQQRIAQLLDLPRDYGVIEAQMDRYRRAQEGHSKWAPVAKQCVEFYEGNQWTEAEIAKLTSERRPIVTRNKIQPLMRLLLGYFRQNRYDIDVLPSRDGTGIKAVADSLTQLIKQIGEANQSEWNDAQVFQDGLFTGRGYWDIRMDFTENHLGEVSERVVDPFSVYIDPESDTYDPKSWGYVMESRWLSVTDLFLLFGPNILQEITMLTSGFPITHGNYYDTGLGDMTPERFFGLDEQFLTLIDNSINIGRTPFDFVNRARKIIRVVDCQHKVLKSTQYFVDLETGQEKLIPTDWPREKIQRVLQWTQQRQLPVDIRQGIKKCIRWTTTAADRILWDDWSIYDDYTIVPFFPYFRRGKTQGSIENLIPLQQEINKRSSSMLHVIMATANAGWMIEESSMEESMEQALEEEGATPGILIKYKKGYNAPQRIQTATIPTGFDRLVEINTDDLKEVAGINDSALGQIDRVQSGRAVEARQRQSIVGNEVTFDNFGRSKELKGRKYKSLIQNFYTENRIYYYIGDDGQDQLLEINKKLASGEIVNNVTLGNYDVTVDESPISATFQQGQMDEALDLVERGLPIPPDILIDLSTMPRKEAIKQRLTEQRLAQEEQSRLASIGGKLQLGIPPEAPIPPIVSDGQPMVAQPQQAPLPNQSLPPQT